MNDQPPRRARRSLPDLSTLYDTPEEAQPASSEPVKGETSEETPAPPTRGRVRRSLPDISTLYDEPEEAKTAPAEPTTGAPGVETPPPEAPVPRPQGRARRGLPDISKLYDSVEPQSAAQPEIHPSSPVVPLPGTQPSAEDADSAPLRLPPELQEYLSPDLWRKLTGGTPRSGVLLNALERLRSLLFTLSTYLPGDLVQEKMNRPVPGLVSGKVLKGCLMFTDVSGFTALSERLAGLGSEGAERLTGLINRYFAAMIEILSWSGGTLLKFAGDATLVYFPEQEDGAHTLWAARCGRRMLRAIGEFSNIPTPLGPVSLSMKVGLAAGTFLAASIGSPKRMEYALLGQAVTHTMQAEGSTTAAGQIVVNPEAAELLRSAYELTQLKSGFYLLKEGPDTDLDSFEIRPEKRRARGAMPWSASPQAIAVQIDVALRQIQALTPYLAAELVDRIVAHAERRQAPSEYRPTTVMFCNFTGPEALLEAWGEAGASRVTGLLSAYFTDINNVITRFGGIVSRIDPYSKGTKLLALFGAPVAHEDDPQRAVSAALAMNAELQLLNQRMAQKLARHLPPGSPPALIEHRIGITLGETFAGQAGSSTRREYTVMGDEVNLAARLMSAARMGQVLISERVLDSCGEYFVARPLPAVRLKGKSKAVNIWQVDGPRDDTLLARIAARGPLIGRQGELEQARQALQRAMQGQGGLLALRGPAGMGKSHLADTLLDEAMRQGCQVLAYQCRSYQSQSIDACWSGLVRSLAGITSIDHPLIQKDKLERISAQYHLRADATTALIDLLDLRLAELPAEHEIIPTAESGEESLFDLVKQKKASRRASSLELFSQLGEVESGLFEEGRSLSEREVRRRRRALAALLGATAAATPTVVFFEDAHWMDPSSHKLLLALSEELSNQPLLFLTASRPHEDQPEPPETITLKPFNATDTTSAVAAILVGGLGEIIHEQSGGNPLFVEQISRWIQRNYKISVDELKTVLQSSNILQSLVLSSVESLPEGQRQVARIASIIGPEFRRSEVEALLPESIDPVTLSTHLRGLTQARMVQLTEAGVDPRYTFAQSLVHDVLYTSLPFEQRRELHGRLASYLANRPGRRRELRNKIAAFLDEGQIANPIHEAEILAQHYERSEQWLPAAQQFGEAAGLLNRQGERSRAEALYARGLTLLERCPSETGAVEIPLMKAAFHIHLGDAAVRRENLAAGAAAYESAAAALANLPEPAPLKLALRLAARLVILLPGQGKAAQAHTVLAQLRAEHPEAEGWAVHAIQAWLDVRTQRDPGQSISAARALLPDPESNPGRRALALLNELSGNYAEAVELYLSLGQEGSAALTRVRLGDRLATGGQPAEAAAQYELAAETWKDAPCGLALAGYRQAELAWQAGDKSAAVTQLEEALAALAKASPVLQTEPRAVIQKALARRRLGPWEAWQWQPFEDLLRVRLLFPIFTE